MSAKRLAPLLPPFYFLVLTLVYLMPLPLHWKTHVPGDYGQGDSVENLWSFWYFPYALSHHLSPIFHTNLLFYPDGINLLFKTSNMIGAILMMPITLTLGVCAGLNTWILLQIWLGGWFFYKFIRRLGPGTVAAYFAGTAYACSPFVTAHLAGHYTLVCVGFPALILYTGLVLYEWNADCRMGRAGMAVLLGLLWAGLALTDFSLTIMTILLFAGLLIHIVRRDGMRTGISGGFPVYLIIGMAVSLVCVAPMIAMLLKQGVGSNDLSYIKKSAAFVADLSALLMPSSHHWLLTLSPAGWPGYSFNDHTMESEYLGLALLVAVVMGLTRTGIWRQVLSWIIVFCVAFVLAGGNSFTENSPFTWPQRLIGRFWPTFFPLSEFRVPSRWIFVMQTAAAIIAAFGLERLLQYYAGRGRRFMAGLFALLVIDLFRPPMIAPNGPEATLIPGVAQETGTVLDLGIGFWGGNDIKVGALNLGTLRRQMYHARPILSAITSRLPEAMVDERLREPELEALLGLQKMYSGIAPVQIPDLDWAGFARRYNISTLRIPKAYRQATACKELGERMLPGIVWTENAEEIVGSGR